MLQGQLETPDLLQARKAMQEQLAKNKELMQKVRVELPEEEPVDVPGEDSTSVAVPTVTAVAGGANPWMLGKPRSPAEEPERQEGLGAEVVPGAAESKEEAIEEEEEEEEMSEEEALLQDFAQKRQVRQQRAGSPDGRGEDGPCSSGQRRGVPGLFTARFPAPLLPPLLLGDFLTCHLSGRS